VAADPSEVVVVGAGPSGLFMALELARHGVRPRIFERTPTPHHQARATALQPGTLEMLARAGILDDVLAASHLLPYARLLDADLNVVSETPFAQAGCRWGFQASLPQYRTEEILTAHLHSLGVSVERGVQVTSLQPRDDGVLLELERSAGTRETVEAEWVLGAGGADSVTRNSMIQTLRGETYPGTAMVGDVKLRGNVPRDGSALVATPHGYVLLAALPDDRWITFVGTLDDDEERRLTLDRSLEAIATAIHRRIRAEVVLEDVAWSSLFRMHSRQAPRLAGERRFLLGDAGHLSSPFGGEGLNSGLHDAHNLAWKLALVLRGRGQQALIDSFGYERESADRHVLEVSNRLHQLVDAAVRAEQTGVRPAPPTKAQARALTRSRAMLDVSYAGSPIVGEHPGGDRAIGGDLALGERYPDAVEPFTSHQLLLFGAADAAATSRVRDRWRGLVEVVDATGRDGPPAGVVLVRPDGFIGFRSAAADAASLEAVDAHLSSYLLPA
jgi:6-methylpretetramide 4-monooxygenase / 4-hydroxy-6-methylpretetramide 12a-monooxygenase